MKHLMSGSARNSEYYFLGALYVPLGFSPGNSEGNNVFFDVFLVFLC